MTQQSLSSFFSGGKRKKMEADAMSSPPPAKRARVDESEVALKEEILVNETLVDPVAPVIGSEAKKEENVAKSEISSKAAEKLKEWRNTLPPYVPCTAEWDKNDFQQQSTQQAQLYRATKYSPLDQCTWQRGEPVPYLALSKVMNAIENTSKRLEIIELYSQFLRTVVATTPSDLLKVIYLSTNQVAPAFKGIELGIGESLLIKAIAESTQNSTKGIKALYHKKGDLGTVAKECRSAQRTMFTPKPLTVQRVFSAFYDIALMKGNASGARKVDKIKGLLVSCKEFEATYVIRSLEGKLRIGLAGQTVLSGIAHAFMLTPPRPLPIEADDDLVLTLDASKNMSEKELHAHLLKVDSIVKQVFCQLPSYEIVIPQLLAGNLFSLEAVCPLTPGIPLKPMLAHPTKGVSEVLQRFENMTFTCEYKYDGERAQIHRLADGTVKVYSRNAEDNTQKFPDLIELMPLVAQESASTFVIDCEAVAYDTETKKILPFQVLSTRSKKDVQKEDIKVQVCLYAFDILYLNGESYLQVPFAERRTALYSTFSELEGKFSFAKHAEMSDTEEIEEFLDKSIKDLCEGLMIKTLEVDASYEPAKRSHNWLKLKKDYLDTCGDSLDLVVIGGYKGRGKRTGKYGGFLLACYDPESEEYQSICKIGTGFSDAVLAEFAEYYASRELLEPPSYYQIPGNGIPDVWFPPERVVEVKAADLSISPNYRAAIGLVDDSKGISLRFPRLLGIREDKKAEDATDAEQVAQMYYAQANKVGQ